MKKLELSIKTTSSCQRRCRFCTVKSWMDANPGFQTSIEQIENLIKHSKESSYHWEYILLSGGEPLLWTNIVEGTKLLYESGITSRLILLTNGLAITTTSLRKIDKIIQNVHEFRISRYSDNLKNIFLAEEYYGTIKNIYYNNVLNIVDRQEHLVPPEEPVPDSLPDECTCRAYAMVGDFVDWCGPNRCIANKFKKAVIYGNGINEANFLNNMRPTLIRDAGLEDLKDFLFCNLCISNAKVARTLKKEKA